MLLEQTEGKHTLTWRSDQTGASLIATGIQTSADERARLERKLALSKHDITESCRALPFHGIRSRGNEMKTITTTIFQGVDHSSTIRASPVNRSRRPRHICRGPIKVGKTGVGSLKSSNA
jgi:hypothetical protein